MTPPKSRYELLRPYAGALPGPWVHRAACAGFPVGPPPKATDPFFPEGNQTPNKAKAICGTCPVTGECAEFAMSTRERYGVWGGTSEPERHKLLGIRPKVH